MTPVEFTDAIRKTRMQPRAAEAARLVLVDGISQAEAGRRCNLSRPAVSKTVARILQAAGWREIRYPAEAEAEILAVLARYR